MGISGGCITHSSHSMDINIIRRSDPPGGIKHDDAVGFTQLSANLICQCDEHRLIIPIDLSDER